MTDLLAQDGLRPFVWAIGVVLGLLALELALQLFGLGGEPGAEAPLDAEVDAGLDVADGPDPGDASPGPVPGGLADLLGLRGTPLTVWLALLAAAFAGTGLAGQMALHAVAGTLAPAPLAALLAAPPALLATRALARGVARLLPRQTTAAISERSLGRRFGDVTVGTARAGQPAQVRLTDQHGNLHYLMAEPLDPADEFPAGSRVLVLRGPDGRYRLAGPG